MPRIPFPVARPNPFNDRFELPVSPQFATGNMDAARDTLTRNMSPTGMGALTQLIQSLMLKEALSQPFGKSYTPEPMPDVPEQHSDPVPLLEIPDPRARVEPIEERMGQSILQSRTIPEQIYNRIGFPEAVNPMTFAARLSQNYVPNEATLKQFEGELPKIDPAQDMVNQVIDNPEGEP